jgi:transposase-like protein
MSSRTVFLLLHCWQKKMSFGTTASVTGLAPSTVRRYHRLFRRNLVHLSPEMGGTVEVDEAFFGRRRFGRQRIVVGAIERRTGRIVLRPIKRRDDEHTDNFLLDHVMGGSTVCTDGALCYQGIDAFWGYKHVACNHSIYHFGPTNRIEAVWSSLKRYLIRTLGRPTAKDLSCILREFEARKNHPDTFESPQNFLENSLILAPLAC